MPTLQQSPRGRREREKRRESLNFLGKAAPRPRISGLITFPIQTLLQILPFLKTSCIFFSPSQTVLISYSHMILSRGVFWPRLNNLFQRLHILNYSLKEEKAPSVPTPGKTAPTREVGGWHFSSRVSDLSATAWERQQQNIQPNLCAYSTQPALQQPKSFIKRHMVPI